jgi:FHS family L-fucose permease-like MFS transporter
MFPTIFALTLGHFPESEAPGASGVLCLGIVGGAVVSQAQGALADAWGIQASFTLPLLCYVYIIFLSITVLRPVTPRLQTEC